MGFITVAMQKVALFLFEYVETWKCCHTEQMAHSSMCPLMTHSTPLFGSCLHLRYEIHAVDKDHSHVSLEPFFTGLHEW